MKENYLIIKRPFLEKILSGDKTEEFREVRPTTASRYIEFKDGVNDIDNIQSPVHYDALRLVNGYGKSRSEILVEVKDAELIFITDEDGNDATYQHKGETYLTCQMKYSLGEILERKNC